MKALVTGAGGFLGTALVARLLARGERDLRLFVRSPRPALDALAKDHADAKVDVCLGTLDRIDDARRAIDGVDIVYHLVAAGSGTAAQIFQTTVVASQNLLDAIVELPKERRPRVVLVGSFGVYGVGELRRGAMVDESTPLEAHPDRRDLYSKAKLRQEKLFREYRDKHGLSLVVVRPGVIYGAGGTALSTRIGLSVSRFFLHLGGHNLLPLTYVDNCAEAIAIAGRYGLDGEAYNVVDDDLPTCSAYLREYRKHAKKRMQVLHVPYAVMMGIAVGVERFNAVAPRRLPLPPIFSPYRTATTWAGNRFSNAKLKSLGFKQIVSTREGMNRTFASLSK